MSDDEHSKKNGAGDAQRRARRNTPVVVLPTPEDAARRLAQLSAHHRRTAELGDDAERLVREGGYDDRARAFLIELADHYDDLANMDAGTGRALRRLAEIK